MDVVGGTRHNAGVVLWVCGFTQAGGLCMWREGESVCQNPKGRGRRRVIVVAYKIIRSRVPKQD